VQELTPNPFIERKVKSWAHNNIFTMSSPALMKPILLFFVIAALPAWFFGSAELETYAKEGQISGAPAYATGVVSEVLKTESRRGLTSFSVRYQFQVDGKPYSSSTSQTDEQGAIGYVKRGPTQIAYDV